MSSAPAAASTLMRTKPLVNVPVLETISPMMIGARMPERANEASVNPAALAGCAGSASIEATHQIPPVMNPNPTPSEMNTSATVRGGGGETGMSQQRDAIDREAAADALRAGVVPVDDEPADQCADHARSPRGHRESADFGDAQPVGREVLRQPVEEAPEHEAPGEVAR